ncbi:MAG: GAF domain-containing protein [bacterium]|nr:GAF domain-containing protein [bacterium]
MKKRTRKKQAARDSEQPLELFGDDRIPPVMLPEKETEPETLEEKVEYLTASNRQLKRKVFDLYTIFEISRNFNAVLDYQLLLETFIFTCLGQVGLLKGAIFLKHDVSAHEFYMVRAKGSGGMPSESQYFPDDSKLAGYLTRLNRPVLVDDLTTDIASESEKEILDSFAQGVVVPLIHQTHLAGLFLLADKISGREFTSDDMEFLSALGNQIAVAIENARLYEAEKDAMQQLRAAQQQLVQSERLAALGEISAKIAHEVNNPLGIIKNYVLLLKRSGSESEKIVEYSDIVGQEIDRIAGIVRQLRDFQRPVKMERGPVDIKVALEEILTLMERQLQSTNVSIDRRYGDEDYVINGNADSLKQVFLNLIINSRAAMEDGGKLTVCLKKEDGRVQLQFCDTGTGISPEIIPRIFDPFFTTKGEAGTGMGLSVCYGIIKSLQGTITYKNLEPGGCFAITLPLLNDREDYDTAG